jgi:EAL domain-containing protein (putative c-di-GMP-specific phosphodiesterase class I)
VGSRQLQEPDFLERLRVLLAEQPTLPRGLLSLEILETSALEDISRTSGLMESCRELGVNFALDDFGTGYSSLAYLKLLPVSCLKIDQSFVIHLTSAPENRSIVDGIMGLARAFGREVIAEGVETVEHARQLLKLGCYRMQGFGIARPMPADELPAWATQWPQRTEWLALCDSA